MIIEKIYWLLEILAVLICLASLNGRKIKININSILFMSIDLLFMQLMQDNILSRNMYLVVCIAYFIYAYMEFDNKIGETIFKCIFSIVIIGILQVIVYLPAQILYLALNRQDVTVLAVNLGVFIIIWFSRCSNKYKTISDFCINKDWILKISLFVIAVYFAYYLYSIKDSYKMLFDSLGIVIVFIILLSAVVVKWQKTSVEVAKKDEQLRISSIYDEAFQELILTTRKRQHDLKNHIQAIYGMHIKYNTYEELVEGQAKYCDNIVRENKYSKVLNGVEDPIVAGFLFSKFSKSENKGVNIIYNTFYKGTKDIPVFDIIEILGILLDNAEEAVLGTDVEKVMHVDILEDDKQLIIDISNPIVDLKLSEMMNIFKEVKSSKESGRGIGLQKLKDFQKQYNFDIMIEIDSKRECDWLDIKIIKK